MPVEPRLASSMLRNAGLIPQNWLQQVGALDQEAKLAVNDHERPAVARNLGDMHIRLGGLTDGIMHKRYA